MNQLANRIKNGTSVGPFSGHYDDARRPFTTWNDGGRR